MSERIPISTYRLQLNSSLTFADALALVDYLSTLGIGDLYASPILAARRGSVHGYDVVDPTVVNPELGGEPELLRLASELTGRAMGLLVDIVPNHMCVAPGANRYWFDVLENGRSSRFAGFFDIDWNPPKLDLTDKVLLPILGDQYGRVLESKELVVELREGAFVLRYYEAVLPLAPKSWVGLLELALETLRASQGESAADTALLESILTALRYLPSRTDLDPERQKEREREKEVIKARLAALVEQSQPARQAIEQALHEVNGREEDPHSFDRLDALLSDQAYRLASWKVAADEVNYRRFFDINDLAAIRVEDPVVFGAVHSTVLRLVGDGAITGLRIDHVDGLLDPNDYLRTIQRTVGARPPEGESSETETPTPGGAERAIYLVVEKILAEGERLPGAWPVHGTTGYDFLNFVGGLFIDPEGFQRLDDIYTRFTGASQPFSDIAYECKKSVMRHGLSSQIAMLARRLDRVSEQHRHSRDFTFQSIQEALVEVLACLPVYRTYIGPGGETSNEDRRWIELAVSDAIGRNPATSTSVFEFVRSVLLGIHPPGLGPEATAERIDFVRRLQQLTGAVMAKAVEDTAFYRHVPLASRGEVGGTPDHPGVDVEQFHAGNSERLASYPHALLTTSTHDTKRSEDVRARMRVLSEMPETWQSALEGFRACNAKHKLRVGSRLAPAANEEYLLYQTLLGTWPVGDRAGSKFVSRIQAYMQKAIREAEVNSSWISPNEAWETAVAQFVEKILDPVPENDFLARFSRILRPVAKVGMYGSLSQVLLKATCPGVPDLYQGNELWDLSLVDPDNRRPVDFALRRRRLAELDVRPESAELAQELLATAEDGRIKLYVTSRALRFRRAHSELFAFGGYAALHAQGPHATHAVAFARTRGEAATLTVAGRHFLSLGADETLPVGETVWRGTTLRAGEHVPGGTYRDVFTGLVFTTQDETLNLAEVLCALPVALLEKVA
ncbi:MAG: malto-oligosyltrehalose synthase [Polyangiaceae bacterium]|nr:malto-oligosyltrehalose synthase [Polyangiaceae bacterium]